MISDFESLLRELEKITNTWAERAWGIESAFGDDCPSAKVYRTCRADLDRLIHETEEVRKKA